MPSKKILEDCLAKIKNDDAGFNNEIVKKLNEIEQLKGALSCNVIWARYFQDQISSLISEENSL